MAKEEAIYTESYISVGGRSVNTKLLSKEQKNYVGACIQVNMLNAAHGGRAVFEAVGLPPLERVFLPCEERQQ